MKRFPTLHLLASRLLCRLFGHNFVDRPNHADMLECEHCHALRDRQSFADARHLLDGTH